MTREKGAKPSEFNVLEAQGATNLQSQMVLRWQERQGPESSDFCHTEAGESPYYGTGRKEQEERDWRPGI